MITKFESNEEKQFLKDLLYKGVESTNTILDELPESAEYHKKKIIFRQRCFAFLEEHDEEFHEIMSPTIIKTDSELQETKCDIKNLYNKCEILEKILHSRISDLMDKVEKLEESLINRITENTSYVAKVNGIIEPKPEVLSEYDKLSGNNKLTIYQMISELNKAPGSIVIDYMIGS